MRRRILGLSLCVVLACAIGAYVAFGHHAAAVNTNGPLYVNADGFGFFDVAKPGQGLVISEPPIENRSTQPVMIDSISLDIARGSTQPMVILQTAVGLPQRSAGGGVDLGSISQELEGPFVPARGAAIGPAGPASANGLQGYGLIFAVNIAGSGMAWSTGVSVRYHVGSTHYIANSHTLFVICTNVTSDCRSAYEKATGDTDHTGATG